MPLENIVTDKAPAAAGPYSQGIKANGFIFTSGQIPVDSNTGAIPATMEEQTRKVMGNLVAVLAAAGAQPKDVLKVTIYLTDMKMFGTMNLIYAEYFDKPYPSRSCVGVTSLPKGVQIMVDAVALCR